MQYTCLAMSFVYLLLLSNCGYNFGGIHSIKEISLTVFENKTDWLFNEYELTYAIEKQLISSGIRLNKHSPYKLTGAITHISQPKEVEVGRDVVVVSLLSIKIFVKLYNMDNGRIIFQDEHQEDATIVWNRGENLDTAKAEIFDKIAKWVVSKLEIE